MPPLLPLLLLLLHSASCGAAPTPAPGAKTVDGTALSQNREVNAVVIGDGLATAAVTVDDIAIHMLSVADLSVSLVGPNHNGWSDAGDGGDGDAPAGGNGDDVVSAEAAAFSPALAKGLRAARDQVRFDVNIKDLALAAGLNLAVRT